MRKITSPSERWPGYIGLSSPLTYPQIIRIQDMIDELSDVQERGGGGLEARMRNALLPYLFEFIEEWGIEGIEKSPATFPGEPLDEANAFIDWWYLELMKVFDREDGPKNG